MPGASDIPKNKLNEIGKGSESVLEEMRNEGKDIKQIESFVTAGAIFCVYDATSEDLVHPSRLLAIQGRVHDLQSCASDVV